MPFSWVKVPSNSSYKIRKCVGDDHSKRHFAACVRSIVEQEGGTVESLWFELNGRLAHVNFYYETEEQRANLIFDLEGEDVVDLVTPEEIDHRRRRHED
jgi:hypothetical protein